MTITTRKHNAIVALLARGVSYHRISQIVGVSKGSVATRSTAKNIPVDGESDFCPVHKTTTMTGGCVTCRALAMGPKDNPLPDGSLDLDLDEEHAKREAEIVRYRPTGGDE